MILVVNPNPAVDRVAVVAYREKATLRPVRFSFWAGGSGVHAAYVAHLLGSEVRVQGFVGGHNGARFQELLGQQGLAAELVEIEGETRGTFSLLDAERGDLCNVVEPGPTVTLENECQLETMVLQRLRDADLMIVSGSVPPGCSIDFPARLVAAAHETGVQCIADLAGEALLAAIPNRPWLVKPSRTEIAELIGADTADIDTVLPLAREWIEAGVANVCVSLDADGVLWVSADGVRQITAPAVPPYNSIGCGDTLVGALAAHYVKTRNPMQTPDDPSQNRHPHPPTPFSRYSDAWEKGASGRQALPLSCSRERGWGEGLSGTQSPGSRITEALRMGVAAAAANITYDAPGFCTPNDIERLLPRTGVRDLPYHHRIQQATRSSDR